MGGWGLYFPTYVTLALLGIPVQRRSSDGFSTITLVKEEQPAKAFPPMLVTLLGIVMLFKDLQPAKAYKPMLVTLSGIVMLVKDSQPAKASSRMLVTGIPPSFDGMVRDPDGFGETPVITASPLLIVYFQL